MNKLSKAELRFWERVYVGFVRSGETKSSALFADLAVKERRERDPKRPIR